MIAVGVGENDRLDVGQRLAEFRQCHGELVELVRVAGVDHGEPQMNVLFRLQLPVDPPRLLGDAADSPVIQTKDQISGTIGLGYRFSWWR